MGKKIGILTFHYAHNYGAVLQAYALKTKLQRMGYEVQVLNYRNKYIARSYRKGIHIDFWKRDIMPNRWGRILGLIKEQRYGSKEWCKQWESFEDFIQDHLMEKQKESVLAVEDLEKTDCDLYILGSDQIWAKELTHGLDMAYFGQFAGGKKKISYAASVPNGDIPEAEKQYFKEYLSSLAYISVREEKLAEELRSLLKKEVTTVVDPTLLLEEKDYDTIVYDQPIVEEPYIFAYYVVENKMLSRLSRQAANMMKCKLVELHYHRTKALDIEMQETREILAREGKDSHEMIDYVYTAGPREFLTYIRDAQMVLTNSFHGTVFSILFRKKFYSVYETNGRIENLLGFLGLEDRHITEEKNICPEKEIDYADMVAKLESYRHVSSAFLQKSIEE